MIWRVPALHRLSVQFFVLLALIVLLVHLLLTTLNQRNQLIKLESQLHPTNFYRLKQNISTRNNSIHCYRENEESIPDILKDPPKTNRSIFFHETSCNSFYNGKISLKARQACAVESAAKMNPHLNVYVLFTAPATVKYKGDESDDILQAVLSYSNVKIRYVNYEKYTEGTPVEELYKSGKLENSLYAISHASDVLRYLTLWKYGGIYLDLDVVVIKTLETLPMNMVGIDAGNSVGAGAMSFEASGNGHKMVEQCLQDLQKNFKGHSWSANGPGIILRFLKAHCGLDSPLDMVGKDCGGFNVFPPDAFYPVHYSRWSDLFKENIIDGINHLAEKTYAVHFWNKLSEDYKIPLHLNVPYLYFARKFCPRVVDSCRAMF